MSLRDSARQLPQNLHRSFFRSAAFTGTRRQASLIANNWFLHIHAVRVHPYSLRPTSTFGLGIIAAVLFGLLTVTGILLMFYYVPTTESAYATMQDILYVIPFGRVVRNLHRWTAEGMVVIVVAHLVRVFFTGSYKPPREFNWLVGVGLLTLTLALSFTGYLLPWDQLSFWAVTVGTNIVGYWPIAGEIMRALLLGGESITEQTLLRFYVLHVILLPAALALLVGYHVWRIRKDAGLAKPLDLPGGASQLTYPNVLYVELALALAVSVVFLVLAYGVDAPLGAVADSVRPPNPAKAPWYFVGMQELVSYSPVIGGVAVPALILSVLMLLPYLDRDPHGVGRWFPPERKRAIVTGGLVLVVLIGLTFVGSVLRGPNWTLSLP